jgi:pantoate--beta-alanine ligase
VTIRTVESIADLRRKVAEWKAAGLTVGLVPTMGALHDGHLSLITRMLGHADRVVTTIFVNPTQFGAGEDLDAYPRTREADTALIADTGGHLVFAPSVAEIYPEGFATRVEVDGLTDVMDGVSRPGHFDGVTLVVSKLLNMAQADFAIFGEKDWQQLSVIRRMAKDLDIPTKILGGPIIRDEFGLALSSRNAYLNEAELAVARQLNVVLRKAAYDIAAGGFAPEICADAAEKLLEAGFRSVDYVECRDAASLEPVERVGEASARIFGAAHIGRARLIDNHAVV